jgi:hypothetical protein
MWIHRRTRKSQRKFSFENPSGQAFNVEGRSYLNNKLISSDPLEDLKGSGDMAWLIAGEKGQGGTVQAGAYRVEILLNGKVVLSAEAVVK